MIATAHTVHSQAVEEWRRRPVGSKDKPAGAALGAVAGNRGSGASRASIVECSVPLARSTRSV